MPLATIALQREYQRKWMAARRAAYFAGKCCALCGSTDRLELDHIDPATKVHHRIWSWSEKRRLAELAKCRPLCRACHIKRHADEKRKPLVHGTEHGYQTHRCRCVKCRAANAVGVRQRLRRKRERDLAALCAAGVDE